MKLVLAHKSLLISILVILNLGSGFSWIYVASNISASQNNAKKDALLLQKESAIASLEKQITSVNSKYTALSSTDTAKQIATLQTQLDTINNTYSSFGSIQSLITSAKSQGIDITTFTTQLAAIQAQILANKFSDALTAEGTLTTSINNAINQKKSADAAKAAQQYANSLPSNLPGSSFTQTTVNAQGNSYTVYYVSIDLSSPNLKIITDTAQTQDCTSNCQVDNLMDYYNRDHGFAAINGTYFCPIDYASCSNSSNSYGYPFYNSNANVWINKSDFFWIQHSALTFNGTHPTFYPDANSYSGTVPATMTYPPVTAGFVMAPGLVSNGQIIVGNFPLDTKSSSVAATRGAMGIKGNTLIIADAFGCTVPQMAYIMQAMGVDNALSLDGGGSTAMIYNGQYILGPGRNIPNAIVFSRN